MKKIHLIHYGELALKSGNRKMFEERLATNIRALAAPLGRVRVKRLYGRMIVEPETEMRAEDLAEVLDRVFGLAYHGEGLMDDASWENLEALTAEILPEGEFTFGVRVKRGDQDWVKGRGETERELGAFVVEMRGWKVNLTDPDIWVQVDVVNTMVIVSIEKRPGLRGLPQGVSGQVMALFSGGIDSPAAAFAMMSRGCHIHAIHFHSAPYTSQESQDKVFELAQALVRFQPKMTLHMVPFAKLQQEIVKNTPAPFRVLLYRRYMLRIAEVMAKKSRCLALVTGESVGQVASQTLRNMETVDDATDMLVLRPLVGTDKEDIIRMAIKAGTYDISILPHEDCCSYLMPKKPATRSRIYELERAEKCLDVDDLYWDTIRGIKSYYLRQGAEPKMRVKVEKEESK
ncbi:MAG: thiamine biosynthesis protein ThiI, partial [Planctomycetota bacterium]